MADYDFSKTVAADPHPAIHYMDKVYDSKTTEQRDALYARKKDAGQRNI